MFSRLGWYFKAKRQSRGLTIEALAAMVSSRNIKKAVRRILRLERDGHCPDTLLVNLAEALGIRHHILLDLMERDDALPLAMPFPASRIASADPYEIAPTIGSS